jgi:D-glycerate 3-kinase
MPLIPRLTRNGPTALQVVCLSLNFRGCLSGDSAVDAGVAAGPSFAMIRESVGTLLAIWLKRAIASAHFETVPTIGLSAPQGAGKTTIMREVCAALAEEGLNTISLSIDDFYLTRPEQVAVAQKYQSNPYLQQRGYPGTHDLSLGVSVLKALRVLPAGRSMKVPGYDRFANSGLGDRQPESDWRVVTGPLHLIVLEGWMLGFTPTTGEPLNDQHFEVINKKLAAYEVWHSLLDGFIWLEPEDPLFARAWRIEAEERSRSDGKSGMSPERIKAFIEMFLPAYATYLPGLRARPPTRPPHLHIIIGRDRTPKSVLHNWHADLPAFAT